MREILFAWLDHRRTTWPRTANPHLLISAQSALGFEPVSHYYLKRHLLLRGVHLERVRADRLLAEADATDGDALHLATLFGLEPTTAMAYANAALALIEAEA
ncbi:hypothetical protein AB0N89_12100 [Amycolatopsis sp. NPDC089917]|uniref:hypothetical protein n=1 Tax=Amycolatopsis sp. NPDC089917 TaxID=3155187 RepID=UPI00342B3C8C